MVHAYIRLMKTLLVHFLLYIQRRHQSSQEDNPLKSQDKLLNASQSNSPGAPIASTDVLPESEQIYY
jgi:hypothetical protein